MCNPRKTILTVIIMPDDTEADDNKSVQKRGTLETWKLKKRKRKRTSRCHLFRWSDKFRFLFTHSVLSRRLRTDISCTVSRRQGARETASNFLRCLLCYQRVRRRRRCAHVRFQLIWLLFKPTERRCGYMRFHKRTVHGKTR